MPKLRFESDDGSKYPEWEETSFGDIIREFNMRTTTEDEDTLLSVAIDGMYLNSELFGHQRGASNKGYKKIKRGTMILSTQNLHLGNANVNLRFDHGIISPAYKTYDIIDCSIDFMAQWIKTPLAKKFFFNATTTGASLCRRNVEWETLYKQKLFIPCFEEQQKIADFLSTVDKVISECQSEVDAWVKYKRGMMQQLFSQKVRFKADDGSEYLEWKEYKLDDICNINPQTENLEDEFYYIDLGSVVSGRLISLETIQKYNAPSRAQRVLSDGDVLFQSVRPYQKNHFLYRNEYDKQVVASTGYCQMQMKNGNSSFLFQLLFSDAFNSEVNKKCTGSNYPAINSKVLSEIKVYIPQATEEQQKIADCLSAFDEVIEKAKQKLEAYKRLKHGLLQQMFV